MLGKYATDVICKSFLKWNLTKLASVSQPGTSAWVIIDRAVLCIFDRLLDDFVMWQWTVDYYSVDKMPTLFTTD